jgi:anti-sigma regulatory factor (Ser/Thr protein kinase)
VHAVTTTESRPSSDELRRQARFTPVSPPPLQDNDPSRQWPLRDFFELGALAGSVPCARYHARQILWEWGLTGLGDSVELVVSELMTNAVSASRSANRSADRVLPVRMWLLSDRASVKVLIWDASPESPVAVVAGDDAEAGRGLLLVEAVSTFWDWYPVPGLEGKVVRALIMD